MLPHRHRAQRARATGEVEVTFEVPRLALLGGDYDLAVGVADQDAPPAGSLDRWRASR